MKQIKVIVFIVLFLCFQIITCNSINAEVFNNVDDGIRREIVFIDTFVPDYTNLLNGISSGTEVVLIDDIEGIEKIASTLENRVNIDAIHVVSHGAQGKVFLGNTVLSSNTLDNYSKELKIVKSSLSAEGDILLYGCDVAFDEKGRVFIDGLAHVTGADIAASKDKTGSKYLGGDWDLGYTTGVVKTQPVFNNSVLKTYVGLLEVFTETFDTDPIGGGKTLSFSKEIGGVEFRFTSKAKTMEYVEYCIYAGFSDALYLDITRADGKDFKFNGISINNHDGGGSIIPFRDGDVLPHINHSSDGQYNCGRVVDRVRITYQDMCFDNFSVEIDTTPPDPPVISGFSEDTGISSSDDITNDQTLIISGTAEADSTVEVFLNENSVGTTATNGSGSWSFDHTGATLDAGSYFITAEASDYEGNVSEISNVYFLTIDTSAPGSSGGNLSVAENAVNGTFVGTVSSVDAVNYELEDNAEGRFAINSANGEVTVVESLLLDYESNTSHEINVRASDIAGNSTDTILEVTVENVNEVPTAVDDSGFISEDEANTITGDVLENDIDPEDDSLEVVSVDSSSNNVGLTIAGSYGSMKIDADGRWTYIFDNESIQIQSLGAGEILTDSFIYSISDGNETAAAALAVTINGVNDAPTVRDNINNKFTSEDELFTLSIPLIKFYDADSNDSMELSASLADNSPLPSWLNFEPNTLSGIPENDDVGSYKIKITATDNSGASVDETFTLSVLNRNDAPFVDLDASNGGSNDFVADFTAGSSAITISDSDAVVTEIDEGNNIEFLTAVLDSNPDGLSEILSLNSMAQSVVNLENLSADYDSDTCTLTISGTALADVYQTVLRGIFYDNSLTPFDITTGDRTVFVTAGDGTDISTVAKSNISVITVPIIDLNDNSTGDDSTVSFTEGDEVILAADDSIISEPDGDNMNQLVIQLTNSQDGIAENITLAGGSGVRGSITVTYDDSGTQITMRGTAAPADYKLFLRELQYNNTSDGPDETDRVITVQGRDIDGNTGEISTITVAITSVNDELILSANTGFTLDEGADHILKNTELLLTDLDNTAEELVFTIQNISANGLLELKGVNLNMGDTFTQADINADRVTYIHNDSETTSDSFIFTAADGSGGNIGNTAVNISITPVNEAPTELSLNNTSVYESIEIDTIVGTLNITDSDIGDIHTYSITGGTGSDLFTISGEDLKVAGALNRETKASYTLEIECRDSGDLTCTGTFIITITDINDNPPIITSNGGEVTAVISVNEGSSTVATVMAEDIDEAATVSYSITDGADKEQFTIDSVTGVLTFNEAPDYEDAGDFNKDNNYEVTVQASDGTLSDLQNIVIKVEDVNDIPMLARKISDQNCINNKNFIFIISEDTFIDIDEGDKISLSVSLADGTDLPEWLDFDADTAVLSGKPSSIDIGTLNIKISAADDSGERVSDTFLLRISKKENNNRSSLKKPVINMEGERVVITAWAELKENGSAEVTLDNEILESAFAAAGTENNGSKKVIVSIPEIEEAEAYTLKISRNALTSKQNNKIEISTFLGTVIVPRNMLKETENKEETAGITIGKGDKSQLDKETRNAVGNRPLIDLRCTVNDEQFSWVNPEAPAAVSIPYVPTKEDLEDPEHIVVWYIEGNGNVVTVPSGRYNPETKTVTFETTHFSKYAVSYVKKSFNDIEKYYWAQKEIEVLASKGIINGTTINSFFPGKDVTRADYLVLLVRTLGFEAEFNKNFRDIKEKKYYYETVGIARTLGIAKGSGDNKFSPDSYISRQDMMVLTERALIIKGIINRDNVSSELNIFSDKILAAPYARESIATLVKEKLIQGTGKRLEPLENTTRAEAAVFLYRIYNKK